MKEDIKKTLTYSDVLLQLILQSLEMPKAVFSLISMPKSPESAKRSYYRLAEKKILRIASGGGIKPIRVKQGAIAKEYIDGQYGEGSYERLRKETQNFKYQGGKNGTAVTNRHFRIAETLAIMYRAGVLALLNSKPEFTTKDLKKCKARDCALFTSKANVFLSSREWKNMGEYEQNFLTSSRCVGLLISPGGAFNVYNTGSSLMKWTEASERIAQGHSGMLVRILCEQYREMDYNQNTAILFGTGWKPAEEFFQYADQNKANTLGWPCKKTFGFTYDNLYYIPLDYNGMRQLRIMTTAGWRYAVAQVAGVALSGNTPQRFGADLYVDGSYLLLFSGNLLRLKLFRINLGDSGNYKKIIYCYDWQEPMVAQAVRNTKNIEVRTFTLDAVEAVLGIKETIWEYEKE